MATANRRIEKSLFPAACGNMLNLLFIRGLSMSWLSSSNIVHRGFFSGREVPENSLASFDRAIEHSYGFELDVQISADGTVFVFHDDDLERLTGQKGLARERTYEELRTLRLYDTTQYIPTFAETLELVGARVPLLVEIKSDGRVGPCESALWELLRPYAGDYAVQSFNPDSVAWFTKNAPDATRGQLISQWTFNDPPKLALVERKLWKGAGAIKPQFLACDMRALPNKWVDEARVKHNTLILAWTARSLEEYHRMRPYADNVIFEGFEAPGNAR